MELKKCLFSGSLTLVSITIFCLFFFPAGGSYSVHGIGAGGGFMGSSIIAGTYGQGDAPTASYIAAQASPAIGRIPTNHMAATTGFHPYRRWKRSLWSKLLLPCRESAVVAAVLQEIFVSCYTSVPLWWCYIVDQIDWFVTDGNFFSCVKTFLGASN